jgi:hypothetical protein
MTLKNISASAFALLAVAFLSQEVGSLVGVDLVAMSAYLRPDEVFDLSAGTGADADTEVNAGEETIPENPNTGESSATTTTTQTQGTTPAKRTLYRNGKPVEIPVPEQTTEETEEPLIEDTTTDETEPEVIDEPVEETIEATPEATIAEEIPEETLHAASSFFGFNILRLGGIVIVAFVGIGMAFWYMRKGSTTLKQVHKAEAEAVLQQAPELQAAQSQSERLESALANMKAEDVTLQPGSHQESLKQEDTHVVTPAESIELDHTLPPRENTSPQS